MQSFETRAQDFTPVHPAKEFGDGAVQLWNGDLLRVLPKFQGAGFDALITDPPYCSGGGSLTQKQADPGAKYCHGGNTLGRPSFSGDGKDQRSFTYWCTLWLSLAREACKEGAYCLVFIDWRQLPAMTDAIQAAGWNWKGISAWNKGRSARAPHKGYFRHQCEYIVWATNGAVPKPLDRGPFDGCYDISVKQSDKHHMTGKPTGLLRQLVQVVPQGGTILDPFMGSGTTGVAACLEGRRFVGCELSKEYLEISSKRIEAAVKGELLLAK